MSLRRHRITSSGAWPRASSTCSWRVSSDSSSSTPTSSPPQPIGHHADPTSTWCIPEDDPPGPLLHHDARSGDVAAFTPAAPPPRPGPPHHDVDELRSGAQGVQARPSVHGDRPGAAKQAGGHADEQRRVHPAPSSTGGWLLRSEPWHGSGPAQGLVRGSAALRYSQAYGRPLPCPLCAVPWPSLSKPTPKEGTP
jgi:hypothetical protein